MEIDNQTLVMGGTHKQNLLQGLSLRLPSAVAPGTYPIEVVDISTWQGTVDMFRLRERANAVIIRAGYGNDGIDGRAAANAKNARQAGLPYGLYWFVKVGKDHRKHVANFLVACEALGSELPPVWDIEYTETPGNKTATGGWLEKLIKTWQDAEGREDEMIYTRASWWDTQTYRADWPKTKRLHVAHYTNAAQPILPKDWTEINQPRTWTLWQWSADGNNLGGVYGAESDDIDRNRFNGSAADFEKVFGVKPYVQAAPEPEPEPVDGLQFRALTTINIRSGPGTNYKDIGDLAKGSVVDVLNVEGSTVWIEIEPGKWCAVKYNGQKLMERV